MSSYVSTLLAEAPPRRVAVAGFDFSGGDPDAARTVTSAFADELAKLGRFEVIIPSDAPPFFLPHTGLKANGTLDLAALVAARTELGVDAFLLGEITSYCAYDPPLLGLRVQMVSATTGEVLWAADGTFDGAEPSVRSLAEVYFACHQERDSLYGSKLVLLSPDRYARFVCHYILSTMKG